MTSSVLGSPKREEPHPELFLFLTFANMGVCDPLVSIFLFCLVWVQRTGKELWIF